MLNSISNPILMSLFLQTPDPKILVLDRLKQPANNEKQCVRIRTGCSNFGSQVLLLRVSRQPLIRFELLFCLSTSTVVLFGAPKQARRVVFGLLASSPCLNTRVENFESYCKHLDRADLWPISR